MTQMLKCYSLKPRTYFRKRVPAEELVSEGTKASAAMVVR